MKQKFVFGDFTIEAASEAEAFRCFSEYNSGFRSTQLENLKRENCALRATVALLEHYEFMGGQERRFKSHDARRGR